MRKLALALSILVLLAAAAIVPLPLIELSPGPALDVPSRLKVSTTETPVRGKLLLLTVSLSEPSALDTVVAWFDPHRELQLRQNVIPAGVDANTFFRTEQQVFDESVQVAAAVALGAAGYQVSVTGGGARIAAVIKGSPADGKLSVGDVVTAVDGRAVRVATDLVNATEGRRSGDKVTLTVRRGSTDTTITLTIREVGQLNRPGIGVALETVTPDVRLPFAVTLNESDIGGPSAGLMLALSIYDKVSAEDLVRGRVIAGTGTIDLNGRVGPIGGIGEKVVSAERAGATLFLAPASQAADARRAVHGKMRIVSVSTFADGVSALRAR